MASNVDRLIVMDHGGIFADGTPDEVFARAEELTAIGLAVPQITEVFLRLRQMGLSLPPVYTVERAAEVILSRKEGRQC